LLNNERLEFLGDSVLDLVISQKLLEHYPNSPEGVLSKKLAALINEKSLATLARSLNLGDALMLGKGELLTGGRDKDSILADAYEALIAAVYLDGGLKAAMRLIIKQFTPLFEGKNEFTDYKTELQEIAQQQFRTVPVYKLVSQSGRDHEKEFETNVLIQGKLMGQGKGKNKKVSEQNAACSALAALAETKTES
jgi:ribonuclease-3